MSMCTRRLPIGAEFFSREGIHFRVWAPDRAQVSVLLTRDVADWSAPERSLHREPDGYFSGLAPEALPGDLYYFRLDGEEHRYADPASRFQPHGPHGPSQVIDPTTFAWNDALWPGVTMLGQVIYEMHVGTFTGEGTWAAAMEQLPALAELGITIVELMPVADFVGRFGWGYDGVDLFAPTRLYGTPEEFRRFVDRAHELKIGVILDVVYNHLGPDGNVMPSFTKSYLTDRYKTDWGAAINFDGENAGGVREFVLTNAVYWISEFHLDGFRLDATQNIFDSSPEHILVAFARTARQAAGKRSIVIAAEDESQRTLLVRSPEHGGYGLDAVWNDDFHHSAIVRLTGHNEAYYSDYLGKPQEFISALKRGFLYQGQWYKWQSKRRGTPTQGVPPAAFIHFLENHDQLANSACGHHCNSLSSPGCFRAMTALLLLSPQTPLLFQGQEFASSRPFAYFAGHQDDLAKLVWKGRKDFLQQFPSMACPEMVEALCDPSDPMLFARCKLDFSEREKNKKIYALHRDLLRLRREDPVFLSQKPGGLDGAVLGNDAFVLRYFADDGMDRLLVVNFGIDLQLNPAPEPLLAPPWQCVWQVLWSSEDPAYGGFGTPPLETKENWRIPGGAAVALRSVPQTETTKDD